ncbi:MAG: hypothetical protein AAGE96_10200 [Cyanobacteria bacterium P01_G01_bin.19]
MQILNNQQVSYCNLFIEESGNREYLPGMIFQDKVYTKKKFFSLEKKQDAVKYCKQKYLDSKGKKSYTLVEDTIGLTVWVENKFARVIGAEDPLQIIKDIDLEDLVSKMRSVGGVKIRDRRYNLKLYKQCVVGSEVCEYLTDKLELSIQQAVSLGQRLMDEKWIHHVVDEQPFKNEHLFYRFYWDEE